VSKSLLRSSSPLTYSDPQYQGFQSSALARGRPIAGAFPSGLQIRQDYRQSALIVNPMNQQPSYSGLQSAPLAAPQEYNIPQHSDPYLATSYGGPYSSNQIAHSSSSLSLPLHLSHMEGGTDQPGDAESPNAGLQPGFGSVPRGQYLGSYEYGGSQQ
jgi:hypothetical protein